MESQQQRARKCLTSETPVCRSRCTPNLGSKRTNTQKPSSRKILCPENLRTKPPAEAATAGAATSSTAGAGTAVLWGLDSIYGLRCCTSRIEDSCTWALLSYRRLSPDLCRNELSNSTKTCPKREPFRRRTLENPLKPAQLYWTKTSLANHVYCYLGHILATWP